MICVLIKSSPNKNNYHIVGLQLYNLKEFLILQHKVFVLAKKLNIISDYCSLKEVIKYYHFNLGKKDNYTLMGNVLRIGDKHDRRIKVLKVYYPSQYTNRLISEDLIYIYQKHGLTINDMLRIRIRKSRYYVYGRNRHIIYYSGEDFGKHRQPKPKSKH